MLIKYKSPFQLVQERRDVYIMPNGTMIANTKHGLHPITKNGKIIKKRTFIGLLDEEEIWQISKDRKFKVYLIKGGI